METKFKISLMLLATLFFVNVSTAKPVKEKREVKQFFKIEVSRGIDLYYTQDSGYSLEIEADEDIIGNVKTVVKGSTLVIGRKKLSFKGKRSKAIVYVLGPYIDDIKSSSGADFYVKNLELNSLSVNVSSGADVKIEGLKVNGDVEISVSSGADCLIRNVQVKNASLSAGSGGDIKVNQILAGNMSISASSGSDIKVDGKVESTEVRASGGADVILKGEMDSLVVNCSRGADVHMKELRANKIETNR
ncbi:MAG: DUF2807 domain-containing protein [Prevotellaceae bacterium]|jgi:hypothetical protein|nr:DUF2807 domain-containing protein [Prevotellaceae bacterium]